MQTINPHALSLVIPNLSHEAEYARVMEKWEALEENIQPELLRRYSKKLGRNVSFEKWLAWCEDDRTTGSMLSTGVPCTLYFLLHNSQELLGSIVVNHAHTHWGHLHAGVVPWHRGKGCGTAMLHLALLTCVERGLRQVEIVTDKDNKGAQQTILRNGGVLLEEFKKNGIASLRFTIDALAQAKNA